MVGYCSCSTTCSSSTDNNTVWYSWTSDNSTTAATRTWTSWNYSNTATASDTITWEVWAVRGSWNVQPEVTRNSRMIEQVEADRKREEEVVDRRVKEAKAREEKRKAAEKKALDLLLDHLDEGQKAIFNKEGSLVVFGGKSGKRYRINKGWSGNVESLGEDGKVFERWCFHFQDRLPEYDLMLAQKLMLESNEDAAAGIANKTRLSS